MNIANILHVYRVFLLRCPWLIVFGCMMGSMFFTWYGWTHIRMEQDPQKIWVSPHSQTLYQQEIFEEHFGKFFRVEQLIFTADKMQRKGPIAGEEEESQVWLCSNNSSYRVDEPKRVTWNDEFTLVDNKRRSCALRNRERRKLEENQGVDLIQKHFLLRLAKIQALIETSFVLVHGRNVSLQDLCYRPIQGKGCLVTSPMQYWLNNATLLANDPDIKLTTACQSTDSILKDRASCMDQNGIPVLRQVVFGGLSSDEQHPNPDPCGESTPRANALIVTFLLHNSNNVTEQEMAEAWEQNVFLKIALEASVQVSQDKVYPMSLTYMAQRSISDALGEESRENKYVVMISYLVMFVYVSLNLGSFPSNLIYSRVLLAFTGILIVLSSLGVAIGVCSMLGIPLTMIAVEVVPFLILAIGVDNMFILCQALDRSNESSFFNNPNNQKAETKLEEHEEIAERIHHTLLHVGPSITSAALSEVLAFGVGATTDIPALQSFCFVAAMAVWVNYLLQMSWFICALVLDSRRVKNGFYDIFPFWQASNAQREMWQERRRHETSWVGRFLKHSFVPLLQKPKIQRLVLVVFGGALAVSLVAPFQFSLGLEQQVALPRDFYLYDYFNDQTKYGEAGPVAYVVIREVDYTHPRTQEGINALVQKLSFLQDYLQTPIYSWINSFNQWRQMRWFLEDKIAMGLSDCPSQLDVMKPFPYEMLTQNQSSDLSNQTSNAMFYPLVRRFVNISIDSACCQRYGICGAQFTGDIQFITSEEKENTNSKSVSVSVSVVKGIRSSRLRFQTQRLNNQSTLVNSFYHINRLTLEWSQDIDLVPSEWTRSPRLGRSAAFAYSLYFIYYDQYLYIQGVALQNILLAVLAVYLSNVWLLGFQAALIIVALVSVITVDVLGMTWLWNAFPIDGHGVCINAVSVVNLVMSVGLSVEFTTHIVTAYLHQQQPTDHHCHCSNSHHHLHHHHPNPNATNLGGQITRSERAEVAIVTSGESVLMGITITKICGIGVLAFAPSHMYQLYFFRMYMSIVLLGALHGLVVLPILLARYGPLPKYDAIHIMQENEATTKITTTTTTTNTTRATHKEALLNGQGYVCTHKEGS